MDGIRQSCEPSLQFTPTKVRIKVETQGTTKLKLVVGPESSADGPYFEQDAVKLKKDSGAYMMIFKLHGQAKHSYRFDEDNPISVSEHQIKPTFEGIDSAQIRVADCDDDKLEVLNLNWGCERTLGYILHLRDRRTGAKVPVDPIVKNGGGIKTVE